MGIYLLHRCVFISQYM